MPDAGTDRWLIVSKSTIPTYSWYVKTLANGESEPTSTAAEFNSAGKIVYGYNTFRQGDSIIFSATYGWADRVIIGYDEIAADTDADTLAMFTRGANNELVIAAEEAAFKFVVDVVNNSISIQYSMLEILPNEYQPLEYLEGDGTAYIQISNHTVDNTDTFDVILEDIATSTGYYRYFGTNNNINFFLEHESGNPGYFRKVRYNSTDTNICQRVQNTKVRIIYGPTSLTIYNANTEAVLGSITYNNFSSYTSSLFYLFNAGGNAAKMRLYTCKLYRTNAEEPTMYLVPCYRKSDNMAGVYDTVGKAFYPHSNGSGTFTFGPVRG